MVDSGKEMIGWILIVGYLTFVVVLNILYCMRMDDTEFKKLVLRALAAILYSVEHSDCAQVLGCDESMKLVDELAREARYL